MRTAAPLLTAGEWEAIRGLSVAPRRGLRGFAAGEQRSSFPGSGIEFAEYREYVPGDDARLLDWNVFLGSRRFLVRVAAQEKELALVVLVDASASMFSGEPSKALAAQRIGAGLAAIALGGGNRAGFFSIGSGLEELVRPERSRHGLAEYLGASASLEPARDFYPIEALSVFSARYANKCLPVLISDFLFPGWESVLRTLGAAGGSPFVVQVLSSEELDPSLSGEATLVDLEDGSEAAFFADPRLLSRYRAELDAHLSSVRRAAAASGVGYALASSDFDLLELFHGRFRAGGLLC